MASQDPLTSQEAGTLKTQCAGLRSLQCGPAVGKAASLTLESSSVKASQRKNVSQSSEKAG